MQTKFLQRPLTVKKASANLSLAIVLMTCDHHSYDPGMSRRCPGTLGSQPAPALTLHREKKSAWAITGDRSGGGS
jgi:hypothetical protein